MKYHGLSIAGKRDTNEDSYLAEEINGYLVLVVADGLGGHAKGKLASEIAIKELQLAIQEYGCHGLEKGFKNANDTIISENAKRGTDMGTTMVACVISNDNTCILGNVGDSRAYIFGSTTWHTKDHGFVEELIRKGVITENEAEDHPQRGVVTRALGLQQNVKVDLYEKTCEESILLLCSDGVSKHVGEEEMKSIAQKHQPKRACKTISQKALSNGSEDNITVVIGKSDGLS